MWIWCAGCGLIILAVIVIVVRHAEINKLIAIVETETSPCSGLMHAQNGSFVEIKGFIEPIQVLRSDVGGRECVCYKSTITREYEEEHQETDAAGRVHRKRRRGTESIVSREVRTRFYVRDDSGRLPVDPEGAQVELIETVKKDEPGVPAGKATFAEVNLEGSGRGQTKGLKFREWVLPVEVPVYIFGPVLQTDNGPVIQKPAVLSRDFIITTKSEEALMGATKDSIQALNITGVVLSLAGIALIVYSLFLTDAL
ncbi:MAG: GIDE domain-containing protein [Candidatus Eremiobacteraeota bacterium]|nr:GIDE domain-containing protein [Candidatus Eremiobacteraeota bacterium]